MTNKYLIADRTTLFSQKLKQLTNKLSGGAKSTSLQTHEQYIHEAIKTIDQFYTSLKEPQLDSSLIDTIRVDDLPDSDRYNELWEQVLNDLTTLFAELENTETLTIANFNFIVTESNRLTAKLKSIDSKLGDYILYSLSPNKDVIFFKDSFNNISRLDVNSPLLNTNECNINQSEGIITLPIDKNIPAFITPKQLPIINQDSNGSVGNNQELSSSYNGDLATLIDNNPDTWFEYERVINKTSSDRESLILDMTINLGEFRVVNHIRINPNNFGTKTVIQIEEIETSLDGQVYTSIKDDIPIAGFTTEDEENIFDLAPSTSKYSGQGLYTFTPRKIKYIHLIFKQSEPYIIETTTGQKLRYAIGLRGINIYGYTFLDRGEFVSSLFESKREINKVLLQTNQNPTQISELANIQYYISPNNGSSWYEIQPKEFQGPIGVESVSEVLDFNTGDRDQIITPIPVKSLRLKGIFSRNDEKFTAGSSALTKTISTKAEIHQVPNNSPFTISLEESPIDGTVTIVDPLFGSRGIEESQYVIGHATDKIDTRRYRRPFKSFPRPIQKVSDGGDPATYHIEEVSASTYMHVEVGGQEWDHAVQSLSSYSIDFTSLDSYKKFIFNPNSGILEFGDGLTTTLSPASDQPITVWFDAERVYPSEDEGAHLATLDFPTSSTKDDTTIKFYDEVKSYTELLPRKATVVRLKYGEIQDTDDIADVLADQSFDASPQTFINGKDELSSTNNWSIDDENGIIYLARPLSSTQDAVATYTYQPITTLSNDDWEWGTKNLLRDSISIKEKGWYTIKVTDTELPSTTQVKVLDLPNLSIVKGTLILEASISGSEVDDDVNPFFKEVNYINGAEELGGEFVKTIENIPLTVSTYSGNIQYFDLKENISTQTGHTITFENTTLFNTYISGGRDSISGAGEWYVEKDPDSSNNDYSRVYFYSTSTSLTEPETVTYYYSPPTYKDNGLYSVDYKRGQIYTQREINPDDDANYQILASYQYSDYRVEYRIARQLDSNTYTVNVTDGTVTIKDSEVFKHQQIPHSTLQNGVNRSYLINYDYVKETREDITSLRDKFTPILKDYALKVLTKGRITR